MEYNIAIKRKEILPFMIVWMGLEGIMLNGINQEEKIKYHIISPIGFLSGAVLKNSPTKAGDTRDLGSIPGLGRSPVIGNSSSLQYFCLENPMDRRASWATVHGVTKSSDTTE